MHEAPGGAEYELDVEFEVDGLLVVVDNHFPGWRAWVDDRPVAIPSERSGPPFPSPFKDLEMRQRSAHDFRR